jgi:hypothetical protein
MFSPSSLFLFEDAGQAFPAAPVGGGFQMYFYDGQGALPGTIAGTRAERGHYLILTNDVFGDLSDPAANFLTADQAAEVDQALDDGMPTTGNVIVAGDSTCLAGENAYPGPEAGANVRPCFSLYIRIQN